MTDVATVVLAMTGEQAEHVLTGERAVEIRRSRMNRTVDRMLIYQTDIGLVVGEIRVRGMLAATPDTIWNEYGAASLMSRQTFDERADGANRLYAYRLEHPLRYETAKPLTDIGVTHAPKRLVLAARESIPAGRSATVLRSFERDGTPVEGYGRPVGAAPVRRP